MDNPNNELVEDEEGISNILTSYYQVLFTTTNPSIIEAVVTDIPKTAAKEMNLSLEAVYTREEVEIALKQMEPLKAPRPDGLLPLFFQHYWQDIGDEVSQVMLNFLTTSSFPSSINHTYITLILKVKSPTKVYEYHSISLCNILYKLVSKVVEKR